MRFAPSCLPMFLAAVLRPRAAAAFSVGGAGRVASPSALVASGRRSFGTSSTRLAAAAGGGRSSAAALDKDLLAKTGGGGDAAPSGKKTKKKKAARFDTNPPKGTRDFYPPDMRLRNWLFDHWKAVAAMYGFSEYDAPVLEAESLYTRKAGEEVTEQLYNFEDKGERRVALRPEMTPSLARMVMAKKGGLTLPLKWFSLPQCWRYERMTRGRRREHYQWNMDVWGVKGVEAEAELLAAMVTFFERVGITSEDVGIKVNSRGVIGEVLTELGVPEEKFAATCVLVDKLEKVPIDAIQDDLEDLGLTREVVEKLTSTMTATSLDDIASSLPSDSEGIAELRALFELCDSYGISDWVTFDASVIRGLAYYTGAVFEAFDRRGELRAIAGGGRYDKLLETFGGEPTPAAGFGFGDAVIVELLKERDVLPTFDDSGVEAVVFAMTGDLYGNAVDAARRLREQGMKVDVVLEKKKTKWVFKHADRIGAGYCVVVGRDEAEKGEVSIKDLRGDEGQRAVKVEDLGEWARDKSNSSNSSL
mmetsp:Transcript_61852/g.182629  ORF Transcript_61852/g.182629 Transcript_61852/m.182629 type:complete len:532 (-) Transcript_61852:120-1715(-)